MSRTDANYQPLQRIRRSAPGLLPSPRARVADSTHPLTGTEANPVAYYRFDEGAGAYDATANHLNGTLCYGSVWTNSTIPTFINVTSILAPGLPGV